MKSKKFVLAALVLLAAINMVLLPLAGCKNDTVPETRKYTVTFNTDGGSTVASQTVESGQKATRPTADPTLEGSWFLGWYSDEGLANEFDFNTPITTATTVYAKWSYKLHTKPTTLTNYTSSHAPEGTWTYVEFGDWPQTILKGDVEVYETKSKEMGMFTYYLGDDSNYYVKHSDKYYKVEPIVWRVLTTSYEAPEGGTVGEILLLAEKILTGGIQWADSSNDYMQSYIRQWLNGNSGTGETSDYNGDAGFLQTAFAESAQNLIADTTVDNSAASTTDAGNNLTQADGCSDTTDKIFLLSLQEATNSEYGFAAYDAYGKGSTRIRVTTDYAKATGVFLGGWWWLRSPHYGSEDDARVISDDGSTDVDDFVVYNTIGGVVPALSISLGGN